MTTEYKCILDGGPNNPLPVTVRGCWDGRVFIVENVEVMLKDGKPYDLYENLTPSTLEYLGRQIQTMDHWA